MPSASPIRGFSCLLVISLLAIAPVPEPAAGYLSNMRRVQGVVPGKQNYVVLDDEIWEHARHDLGDLRLFAGETEFPYVLAVQRGSTSAQRSEAKLLDLGRADGQTQFVIDMTGIPDYDQVELRLADTAGDFVARARVEGLTSPRQRRGEDLGSSILFNLSRDQLGSDFTLRFRPASFHYLRVRVPGIAPDQVLRAIAINSRIYRDAWTPIPVTLPIEQVGRTTVVTWSASITAPVGRIALDVDPSQGSFRHDVEVLTMEGGTITNSSIRRIHLARGGNLVDTESLAVDLPNEGFGPFKIVIQNGDDPPVKIIAAKAYFNERRLYFDPGGRTDLSLYYGNPRVAAPIYEYSRDFHQDKNAAVDTLGLDMRNPGLGPPPRKLPVPLEVCCFRISR